MTFEMMTRKQHTAFTILRKQASNTKYQRIIEQ